jgi:hypothetical protein
MSTLVAHPVGSSSAGRSPVRPGLRSAASRVLVLIPIIWALNLLDLLFTMLATRTGEFEEMNPLARPLGLTGQAGLKLGVLLICTVIFVALRRRRSTEWGCYILLAAYGALAVMWLTQFPFLLSGYHFGLLLGKAW